MKVSIGKGNTKLGPSIPTLSLPPVLACPKRVPCTKDCYAIKLYRWPDVKAAWDGNLESYKSDPVDFFTQIDTYLSRRTPPRYFRLHVSGDFVDWSYFCGVCNIADIHPDVRFLAFTKFYAILEKAILKGHFIPPNLSIVLSAWPHWPLPKVGAQFPVAYMQDGTETRIPANAIECPGNCEGCGMCWSLRDLGRDMVFHKH